MFSQCTGGEMLQKIIRSWKQYRYRFVPWLAFNLKDRSIRYVEKTSTDKIIDDKIIEETLMRLCDRFYMAYQPASRPTEQFEHNTNLDIMLATLGFTTEKIESDIPNLGSGVGVIKGKVPKGAVVSLYPGAVYQPTDPILFQSMRNPFIFRCMDGVLIDGCSSGLSKMTFNGCLQRESVGSTAVCDKSWMTSTPRNPLAIGQYVNNQTKEYPANVAYQEFDLPQSFPIPLRKYIPNVVNRPMQDGSQMDPHNVFERPLRMVVLVALRDIDVGEELFSSYFTMVEEEEKKDGQNDT